MLAIALPVIVTVCHAFAFPGRGHRISAVHPASFLVDAAPTYSTRPGTDDDTELLEIWMDMNREFHSAYNGETRDSQLKFKRGRGLQALVPNLSNAQVLFLLRDDLPDPVGFCSFNIQYTGLGTPPFLYLQDIFIGAGNRGAGAGRFLMKELANLAKSMYCSHMTWNADCRNQPAVEFYERLGAKQTGASENWIHMQWSFLSDRK